MSWRTFAEGVGIALRRQTLSDGRSASRRGQELVADFLDDEIHLVLGELN